ncbi:high-potential iron-sulfur protein [Paraburkholderia silviterrae]|uniref:High-potential iron-sulfur protein n=1 Tax=Paraburkholderia silviterrae TaxID=2528715 RepID=A0A4R5M1D3_9BURK|nr:high-potential iron-sulfur protein [Paraburkholderia silviterrae]TDG19026.1 High potential iron-sulfur protein [Paraburkholderia silviterrae]
MNQTTFSRRAFVITTIGAATTFVLQRNARAEAPLLTESDAPAKALGYHADAARMDKAQFARYAPGQDCGNCSFYQGKPGDAAGACPLFGGKRVATAGWCNAYNQRAG